MIRIAKCAVLVVLMAACEADDGARSATETAPETQAPAADAASAHAPAADGDAGHHEAAGDADALPLLPIMRQLALDMAAMQQALWLEDFGEVETRARAIADHPPIATSEIERIQRILGAEMPEFEQSDVAVHEASVRMHQAAQARDLDALMDQLGAVQRGCMDCHARFRQRLLTTAP